MLVMKTIKDPPDHVSGFTGGHYVQLSRLMYQHDYSNLWLIKDSLNVQITSQVERTEPDELDCPKQYTYDIECHGHSTPKGWDSTSNSGEHTPVEGEDTGDMGTELEYNMGTSDGTTEPVDAGEHSLIGDNDQEDTSEHTEPHQRRSVSSKEDELDIQWVKVITT